jgi:hypothetical protein
MYATKGKAKKANRGIEKSESKDIYYEKQVHSLL